MKRKQMPETEYRASRLCRVLGNPTAYQILKILCRGARTPSALAHELKLSNQTICDNLRNLRQVDLVRYDTDKQQRVYFLKDKILKNALAILEEYAERMRIKRY
ncbi:MAG: ArsR/SmtB family transcription factor [bacterium]